MQCTIFSGWKVERYGQARPQASSESQKLWVFCPPITLQVRTESMHVSGAAPVFWSVAAG